MCIYFCLCLSVSVLQPLGYVPSSAWTRHEHIGKDSVCLTVLTEVVVLRPGMLRQRLSYLGSTVVFILMAYGCFYVGNRKCFRFFNSRISYGAFHGSRTPPLHRWSLGVGRRSSKRRPSKRAWGRRQTLNSDPNLLRVPHLKNEALHALNLIVHLPG